MPLINKDILETIKMIERDNLDIRTTTMGISLLDCVSHDPKVTAQKIYGKITKKAYNLVRTAEQIGKEFGIPVINKRVAVTPISLIGGACDKDDYIEIAAALDRAAAELGIDFIGGYSALVHKGFTNNDIAFLDSIPQALAETEKVCSCVNVGSTKAGINMDAVKMLGYIIKETAYLTRDSESLGCAKFVVFANAVEDNPFMAGAFHGVGEPEAVINVGVSGPGVVKSALEKVKGRSIDEVAETIKKTAFKITRAGMLVGNEMSKRTNIPFGIMDLSLAPTPKVGDSVAEILEIMGLEKCGTHGTTAALALLNDAVKKGGIMACSHVGGLSGAFIPVSEDAAMIDAVICGALTFDKLEAMTSVCSVGLDMIAVSGDVPESTISAIIADEAAIGVINNKTTAVRIIPAYGKKIGDVVNFGGLLGKAPVMAISEYSSEEFIMRGGRIPAPVHSFKN
ncbi:MAG: PFL family protein [Eubacteriaceae bacterium]